MKQLLRSYSAFMLAVVFGFFVINASSTTFPDDTHRSLELQPDTTDTAETDSIAKKSSLPMTPGRVLEFNTDEATWLSLDISPDGEHIVFDLMGDLYRIPAEGGQAEQLTDGMAFDTHPRYSPDGKYILYTSDDDGSEQLYYLNAEDTSDVTQLTKGGDTHYTNAEWTPDGNYVVASKGGLTPKLWLIHKDGGRGTALIDSPNNLKIIDPAVSPDGRYIYFSQRNGAWNYNAQLPQYQVGMYDREDGSRETITSRYGSAFTPVVSDDGKWLVYGSRYEDETGLVIRNLETGDENWLAYPVQRDDQESIATMGVLPGMAFTPDSKNLLASYGGKIYSIPVDGGETVEIPFEVNVNLEIGPEVFFKYPISDDKEAIATQIRDASPSPNGEQLVFTVLNKLYIQGLPDGEPQLLTDSDLIEAQPSWSPDGKWIVYATYSAKDGGALYKLNPNARRIRPEKLTEEPGLYSQPAWSLNSDRIVALKGDNRSYEQSYGPGAFRSSEDLVWIDADGGPVNFIDRSNGRDNPHFVKGNDRIYLDRGNGTLLSIRWDGTDEKEHIKISGITTYGFNIPGGDGHDHGSFMSNNILPDNIMDAKENNPPSNASVITMAPEGDQALAQINNDLYVVTVPVTGGDTPSVSVANPSSSQFPSKKLTEIGGQFPRWSSDATKVHWSIGHGHFIYDLEAAEAYEDSVEAAKKLEEEKKKEEAKDENKEEDGEEDDSDEEEKSEEKKEEKKEDEGYKPVELSIEVTFERDIPEGTVVLRNARIITMNGDQVIERGDILIENNRITEVGTSVSVPDGADEVDLSGKTVVPGFVDTHAHMWPKWGIHKQQVWNYAANLAYGVTTTRDPQTATTDVLTYSDMVEAGMMPGPRVYSTGPGLGFWAYNIKSLDHAKEVMKQYSKYYDTKTIKMYLAGNRKQRQWILMAAKEQSIMPTTEGALNWKLNMTQLIDGYPGHEHSFPIYPIYKDAIQVTAESKMAVTPTLLVSYGGPWAENYYYSRENPFGDTKLRRFTPYEELASKSRRRPGWFHEDEHVFKKHAETMADIVEAGGLAGVGSHGQLEGLGYHWELWAVASGGMDNHDALRVATILGAEAIGLDGDLGSIEAGKLADLVILNANPLDNLRNTNTINMVMKNGRLYNGNTLDQIYPMQQKAPEFEWTQPNPARMTLPGIDE